MVPTFKYLYIIPDISLSIKPQNDNKNKSIIIIDWIIAIWLLFYVVICSQGGFFLLACLCYIFIWFIL